MSVEWKKWEIKTKERKRNKCVYKDDIRGLDRLKTKRQSTKIRGILLGQEASQKLGIVFEGGKDSL